MEWLAYDVPYNHPQFGQVTRCPICGPGQQQAYLAGICGLSPEMMGWTFQNTARIPGHEGAYDACAAVAAAPSWAITLTGPYGVGKTRLLACTVNAGRAAHRTSVYATMAEILDHLRAAYAPNAPQTFDGLWEKIVNATILAIDELDRWNPTPWAEEKFFELIDIRYRHGHERATLCATNSDLDTLPGYLASRLRDRRCHVFEMRGGDMRRVRTA